MKYCMNCGFKLPEEANNCPNCGKEVTNTINNNDINVINSNSKNEIKQTNSYSIAGFIISIISMFCCCGLISWLSLILSIIGLSKSKNEEYKENSKAFAVAGIIISSIVIVMFIIGIIILFATGLFEGLMNETNINIGDYM